MKSRTAHSLVFVAALAFVGAATERVARADDPVAESLYQDGRRAASAKDWPLACAKFRESHNREPAPGTLLNLADCEQNLGTWLAALTHFRAAALLFHPGDERGTYAKQRAAELEKRIPKLTLRLPPAAPVGTVVERDGVTLGSALVSTAEVELGDHTIVVRAPGHAEMRTTIRMGEAETREIALPIGATLAASAAAEPEAPPAAMSVARVPDAPSTRTSPLRTAGYVGLGVGAVGIGVGLLGGLLTMNAKSTADGQCTNGCTSTGLDAESRGRTWSTVSTAAFVAGGIGLAAGAGLLILSPQRNKTTGSLSAHPVLGGGELRWMASF